jgi:hypothetical protein
LDDLVPRSLWVRPRVQERDESAPAVPLHIDEPEPERRTPDEAQQQVPELGPGDEEEGEHDARQDDSGSEIRLEHDECAHQPHHRDEGHGQPTDVVELSPPLRQQR